MDCRLTVAELEQRWQRALTMTHNAVARQPETYREVKALAMGIVTKPLDIKDYLPISRRLAMLLEQMDPNRLGSIFYFFSNRIAPTNIRNVPWLRVECRDLLAHLKAFDDWRQNRCHLKIVK